VCVEETIEGVREGCVGGVLGFASQFLFARPYFLFMAVAAWPCSQLLS
jgi:hypothetical protein